MTQTNTSATSATSGLHSLIALFDKAHASGHAYPNVWLTTPAEAYDIKLYRAGRSSKRPGSITIVNGQDYVGCILRNGDDIQFSSRIRSKTFLADVIAAVMAFAANPHRIAASYGHRTGRCCFCARQLTESFSMAHGYGPICADRWGLPHAQNGTVDVNDAMEEAVAELTLTAPASFGNYQAAMEHATSLKYGDSDNGNQPEACAPQHYDAIPRGSLWELI